MLINVYFQTYFADMSSSNLSAAEDRGIAKDLAILIAEDRGIAKDLAILNSAYFLSLFLLSLTMGGVVSYTGTVRAYIWSAVAFGVLSCLCIWRVITDKQSLHRALQGEKPQQSSSSQVTAAVMK